MSTMSTTLNKDAITWGQKQYHIALCPEDIGEYVLLPGDPARSDIAAKYLDNAELKANNREHRTFTGYYKGVKISVTSTGMGCPSATIAAEELIRIGAKTLIRIGSSAALDPRIHIGDLLISTGAKVLGPFKVGDGARIAANAVVLTEVPDHATAVGIPAQIVRIAGRSTHFADDVDQTSVNNPTLEKLAALAKRVEELEERLNNET